MACPVGVFSRPTAHRHPQTIAQLLPISSFVLACDSRYRGPALRACLFFAAGMMCFFFLYNFLINSPDANWLVTWFGDGMGLRECLLLIGCTCSVVFAVGLFCSTGTAAVLMEKEVQRLGVLQPRGPAPPSEPHPFGKSSKSHSALPKGDTTRHDTT